jgi:3-deoxy-D-manno-octulosonic-acid transferase
VRRLYTLLLYLALPFVTLIVLARGVRDRSYWRGGSARFGFGSVAPAGGIWIHAVSVGEVQAAAILIDALRTRCPGLTISLTCATPTGRARAEAITPAVAVSFGPYDLPGSVRRCLKRLRPSMLIIMETELWPNLLFEAWRAAVPTVIANARVSARSARLYQRLPGLMHRSLATNVWVGAQSTVDAQRFTRLGVASARSSVLGNIKFDRSVAPDVLTKAALLRSQFAAGRPVWIAGSTHGGEEQIVLEAHQLLLRTQPRALLILAPRHPPRFDAVARAVAESGLSCARRSLQQDTADAAVLLLDTLGELPLFYAAADVAFVGGSLVPVGGHNLLEPAAIGLPVLAGPHQFNSPQLAQVLAERGALSIVHDARQLSSAVAQLLLDPDRRAIQGRAARAAVEANRGALERLLQLILTVGQAGSRPNTTPGSGTTPATTTAG